MARASGRRTNHGDETGCRRSDHRGRPLTHRECSLDLLRPPFGRPFDKVPGQPPCPTIISSLELQECNFAPGQRLCGRRNGRGDGRHPVGGEPQDRKGRGRCKGSPTNSCNRLTGKRRRAVRKSTQRFSSPNAVDRPKQRVRSARSVRCVCNALSTRSTTKSNSVFGVERPNASAGDCEKSGRCADCARRRKRLHNVRTPCFVAIYRRIWALKGP